MYSAVLTVPAADTARTILPEPGLLRELDLAPLRRGAPGSRANRHPAVWIPLCNTQAKSQEV